MIRRQRQGFDVTKAIPAAWQLLWADNLAKRAAGEDFRGNTTYLTATDVVEQVRAFAGEQAAGKAWGATGRQWGRSYTTVRVILGEPGGLLGAVRDWLRREVWAGRLEEFAFGRGHISGARYRPAGSGTTATEDATMRDKARRRTTPPPIHFTDGNRRLCAPARRPVGWGRRRYLRTTSEAAKVTCRTCAARLRDGAAE